ncbi:hypothetical protein WJX77_007505 [Trebouxia sp. C0004]
MAEGSTFLWQLGIPLHHSVHTRLHKQTWYVWHAQKMVTERTEQRLQQDQVKNSLRRHPGIDNRFQDLMIESLASLAMRLSKVPNDCGVEELTTINRRQEL